MRCENKVSQTYNRTASNDELRAEIAWRRAEIDQHTNRIRDIEFELSIRDAVEYGFSLAGGNQWLP